jgi:inosine/xanthosine triphosphate pyrophosphatase family protein
MSNITLLSVNLRVIQVDLPEIQEVNTEGIAKEKALLAAQLAGGSSLIEDTSLEFHALGGMPGPYIKWFQERLKSVGLWRILTAYEGNLSSVWCLDRYLNFFRLVCLTYIVFFSKDKSATAVCTLAFSIGKRALKKVITCQVDRN